MDDNPKVDDYLIGIDIGSTNIKAAICDTRGREVVVEAIKLDVEQPYLGWVERDMDVMWNCTKHVIRQSLNKSKIDPSLVIGVGVTGQGDGLYLLDKEGQPVRKGILSIDTRSVDIVREWEKNGKNDTIFPVIGQKASSGNPISILAWLKRNEPQNYSKTKWIIFCKDYIKYKLTGVICTDESDAAATLTDVKTRRYSDKIFEILDLEECKEKLPQIVPGWIKCGEITSKASSETGLKEGTAVASGLHDTDATALGAGCFEHGQLLVINGTLQINEVIIDRLILDPNKKCGTRVTGIPGRWIIANASSVGVTNLNWFIDQCGSQNRLEAEKMNMTTHAYCDRQIESIPAGSGGVLYHPFLYGSYYSPNARAGFYGIDGRHSQKHLLRAVYEGVALSSFKQIENLEKVVTIKEARIGGGGSRSRIWVQIFSDVMNFPIKVPRSSELGALGAIMIAGICTGVYRNHEIAVREATSVSYESIPNPENVQKYRSIYKIFKESIRRMSKTWDELDTFRIVQGRS
ncbi:MAG: FGGY-family carbohydrate kinase [Nitrososphaeria archaeon]|jgi:sugar (pentulose or hexulose) kinase